MTSRVKTGLVLLSFAFCLWVPPAVGQVGIYETEGVGVDLDIAMEMDKLLYRRIEMTGSYAFSSLFEAGVSISRANANLRATGVGPLIAFYPVHQSEAIPVAVRLAGEARYVWLAGRAVDRDDAEVHSTNLQVSGRLIHRCTIQSNLKVLPMVELGYVRPNTIIHSPASKDQGIPRAKHRRNFPDAYFALRASVLLPVTETIQIAVTPRVMGRLSGNTPIWGSEIYSVKSLPYGLTMSLVFPN